MGRPISPPPGRRTTRKGSALKLAFVSEFLIDLNATQAAKRAGYKYWQHPKGPQLLADPVVSKLVSEALARRAQRLDVKADDVLSELVRLARVDPGEAYDDEGQPLPLKKMPEDVRRAIASMDTVVGHSGAKVIRIKWWDKTRALELLARHLGLLNDKLELSGKVQVSVNIDLGAKPKKAEVIDVSPKVSALPDGPQTSPLPQEGDAVQGSTGL